MNIRLFFICFFCFLGVNLTYAQVQQKTQFNSEKQARLVKTSKQSTNQSNTKVDQYMGKKEKILSVLKINYIPSDFPKYAIGSSKENYRNTVKVWLKSHLDIVKEEYHAKIISN